MWRLRFDTRVTAGGGSLRIQGAKGSIVVPLDAAGPVDVPILVPRGRSALTLTVRREGVPAGADPADVLFSATRFEKAAAGDETGALVPVRVAATPGF